MKSRVRTSVIVVHQDKILTFRAVDPNSGQEYFFLPGGKIEDDETAPQAAERETLEETGFQVQVDPEINIDREYFFHWNGEDYNCLTIFYAATLMSPLQRAVQDAAYNKGTHWLPVIEVQAVFNYSSEILGAVEWILQKSNAEIQ